METVGELQPKESTLNPFISIWFRPRGTIRRIVDSDPEKHVIALAVISGIYRGLDNAAGDSMGDDMSLIAILLISLVIGGLGGVLSLYVSGAILRWSGSWFGGTADSREVRAALAWGAVPDVVLLIIFVPVIVFFGHDWFTSATDWIDESGLFVTAVVGILVFVGVPLVVWRAFLTVKCLAEVHRFSAWRSIASILAVVVPSIVIVFGCIALTRGIG